MGIHGTVVPHSEKGVVVRSVLVCLRSSLAAQSVTSCATRLGLGTLRTAVTDAEAMAQLAQQPADLILADTAVTRPDTVGFTRRALAHSPGAVLLLVGAEDPRVAAAAVAAGARGVIRSGEGDVVGTVAKALLLIATARPSGEPAGVMYRLGQSAVAARVGHRSGTAARAEVTGGGHRPPGDPDYGALQVPAQRSDLPPGHPGWRPALRRTRAGLTEREIQVLRGMAEGKSNAEIGRDLYVSEDTVKTHARRLFRKLGARDRAHAVAVGFRTGVLS